MIARITRFAHQPKRFTSGPAFAAVEDAIGVVMLFALLFLGLTFSGSI